MQEVGDDGSKPRLVNHVAYFNTAEDKNKFVAHIRRSEYTLEKSPEPDAVAFSRVSPVASPEFDQVVESLKEIIDRFDGQYDGWGCAVVLE